VSLHVIVGAGPVGAATATLLAERGEQVRILSRRGIGPLHPAIERVAADAADADRLSSLTAGAAALYSCANPPYHRWLSDWPPLRLPAAGELDDWVKERWEGWGRLRLRRAGIGSR
jgi:2-polyprenyl-6-methoxyphenol hydroxylase-like FAD-dependent oxidoreductase